MDSFGKKINQGSAFSNKNNNEQDNKLNPFEIWKQVYFLTESSLVDLVKTTISTDSVSKNMAQSMNSYLDFEKMLRKGMEQYFESSPVPSKKDIARVAKLVIGVEDKVDNLETSMEKKLDKLTGTLSLLVSTLTQQQEEGRQKEHELNQARESVKTLKQKLSGLNEKLEELSHQLSANGLNGENPPDEEKNDGIS